MLLNLQKRGKLIGVLPKKGSLSDQIICKELSKKLLDISDDNKEKIDFVEMDNGDFQFNALKDRECLVEVEFSESEKFVLKRGVDELDSEESVTPELLDMCLEVRDL